MSESLGNGVSRTLTALNRQFKGVVFQSGKPPLDAEFNLQDSIHNAALRDLIREQMPSGFVLDPLQASTDYVTDPDFSNFFRMGDTPVGYADTALWANVNGWVIPVTGTASSGIDNRVDLFPPPASDTRIDLVFLEAWLVTIAPNPSTVNKPSASTIYKYGNTQFGGVNIPDDIEDPTIGFETTERVQLQYRIRVFGQGTGLGGSVALSVYPDGLDDPSIKAQGAASSPVAAFTWANMRDALGDPGLWRAGNGDSDNALNTIDGYSYAIPIAAVFRRNTSTFVARTNAGNANQNGGLNRNPVSIAVVNPAEATRTFTGVTLAGALGATSIGAVAVTGLVNSGLDNAALYLNGPVFLSIGSEIIAVSSVLVSAGTITIASRGRLDTQAVPHLLGAALQFYCARPDGLFSDQVALTDILDLRKAVSMGNWDYDQLLQHNLGLLFSNNLRSSYKQSGASDCEGSVVPEIVTFPATALSPVPNQTEQVDSPDGIREVFSDAVVIQHGVTLALMPNAGGGPNPVAVPDYTAGAPTWETAADFVPSGWQPTSEGLQNGSVINLFLGGGSGSDGARKSAGGARVTRFATPKELWVGTNHEGNQTPFKLRFVGSGPNANDGLFCEPSVTGENAAKHPGPMYPLVQLNFEYPFIVLGGVVQVLLRSTAVETVSIATAAGLYAEVDFPGLDFTSSDWVDSSGLLNPSLVSKPLLHGARTLYDMLTKHGTDITGASSELYLVLTGSTVNAANCGVFRVIGAGSRAGQYTSVRGTNANSLVVEGLQVGWADFVDESGLTAEVRSQYTNTEDGPNSSVGNAAAAVIVMTDLAGTRGAFSNPWRAATLAANAMVFPTASAVVLSTAVIYGPGRGAFARVPNALDKFAVVNPVSSTYLLRRALGTLDSLAGQAGVPTNEIYYPSQGVQTWSGLSDHGLSAPASQNSLNGNGRGALTEQLRDGELFADVGSKTLVLRPFRKVGLSVNLRDVAIDSGGTLIPEAYLSGETVDDAGIFNEGLTKAYSLPSEYMPHFGRQDIPVFCYSPLETTQAVIQTLPFYFGVSHLFADSVVTTDAVFNLIGGTDNGGAAGVMPILFQTGVASGLAYGEFGPIPGGGNGYQSRLYEDINIRSSDLPPGLKGLQLPPFLGVARVYGVYDRREWLAGTSAWRADRVTPETGGAPPKNLIRTDADKQTLFIVQGGAEDVTGNANDHTYVIPANLIDISLSGQFAPGEVFEDLEYVVECEVFGFARGFINLNNYVLARRNNGAGQVPAGLADDISMVLALALPPNECYAAYHRTVYQGDPYMTRGAVARVVSDYEPRFGQLPISSAFELRTAIQQFYSSGNEAGSQVPEIPNARGLEILAVTDFSTTLGTGKIGGVLASGTVTDIGHIASSGTRLPLTNTQNQWQAEPRTFTQGQPENAPRGSLVIRVLQASGLSLGQGIRISDDSATRGIMRSGVNFLGASAVLTAQALADYINATIYPFTPVKAYWNGGSDVLLQAVTPGATSLQVELLPAEATRAITGFALLAPTGYGLDSTSRYLLGGVDQAVNAARLSNAATPVAMTGLTERLPLGILVNDHEFLGEDPTRSGSSMLTVSQSAGQLAGNIQVPMINGQEYARLNGVSGHLGMADGAVLLYGAWTNANTTGTKLFRVYRGASLYVLDEQNSQAPGGPVDWVSGNLPDGAILKGAVLAGRAYLVRNYPETAFGAQTSHGDEIQMVIVTRGIMGESLACDDGYALVGQISPTGYGDGYAAADRYRLEGHPLYSGAGFGSSKKGPNPVVILAPYPTEDPQPDQPC